VKIGLPVVEIQAEWSLWQIELILIYCVLRKILKSTSKSSEIILANNDSNYINILEAKKLLLFLETTMS